MPSRIRLRPGAFSLLLAKRRQLRRGCISLTYTLASTPEGMCTGLVHMLVVSPEGGCVGFAHILLAAPEGGDQVFWSQTCLKFTKPGFGCQRSTQQQSRLPTWGLHHLHHTFNSQPDGSQMGHQPRQVPSTDWTQSFQGMSIGR